jgi:hypothetical protein
MENILQLLEHTQVQVRYFKELQDASPNRKLNVEIKKLKLRAKVLEELV